MKKVLGSVLILSLLLLNSCGKSGDTGCQPVPVTSERSALVAYCSANSIAFTEDPSGLLYQIITPGSGNNAAVSNTVSVVYTGKLLDGTTFTSVANPQDLPLSGLIDGWKIGIPLLKKGGRIKLVIPSALAYSCAGSPPSIPANAPVFFDITLSDIK
jgi:FKBP-type peptidyl-prolyl cis-trans isomerase